MARSISANGEVIYGTSWDNSDYGMLYWEKEGAGFGRPQWVGEDVREITPTVMQYQDGTEYDYNLVNGCICQAQLTKISPSGKWIATTYRTETPSANRQYVEYTYAAAFYNTETGTTTIVEDYGETTGVHVTDDGIGFIGIGTPRRIGRQSLRPEYAYGPGRYAGLGVRYLRHRHSRRLHQPYFGGRQVCAGYFGAVVCRRYQLHQLVHRPASCEITVLT